MLRLLLLPDNTELSHLKPWSCWLTGQLRVLESSVVFLRKIADDTFILEWKRFKHTLQKQGNSLWCEGLFQHGWLFKSDYRRTSSARSSVYSQMLNQNKKTCVFTARLKLQGHPNMRSSSHIGFLQLWCLKENHLEFPLMQRWHLSSCGPFPGLRGAVKVSLKHKMII